MPDGRARQRAERIDRIRTHKLGAMDVGCSSCGALHYSAERVARKTTFNDCCRHGKVSIPSEPNANPEELKRLFLREDPDWTSFHEHIRNYNSALSFASINCKKDVSVRSNGRAPYCFKVQGNVYSLIATSAHPDEESRRKYAQLYVIETQQATQIRSSNMHNQGTDHALMHRLDVLIRQHSRHANAFEMLREEEQRVREQAERDAPFSAVPKCIYQKFGCCSA